MNQFRRILIPVLMVVFLLFTLTACDMFGNSQEQSDPINFYFENKNGELNPNKWISFSGDEWEYYDGSSGVFKNNNGEILMQEDGKIWGKGSFSGSDFVLIKDGKTITYYSVESSVPQGQNTYTMQTVYVKAVELGFEGTLDELIEAFHGKSAYEIAVQNGYTGSEAQWIASLAGSDGKTPMIGANGHWVVGEIDTGVSATGTGIRKIEKTATNNNIDIYTIFMTNGESYGFSVTNGVDGDAASRGTGITKIEKTSTDGLVDTYTITLSDGSDYTFSLTNGKDGKNGKDGADALSWTPWDVYEEAQGQGYEGSYLEFLSVYLPQNSTNAQAKISAACFSTVSIIVSYQYNYLGLILPGSNGGTGVIYKMNKEAGEAYILTNYHLVYAPERVDEEGNAAPGIGDKIYVYLFGSEIVGDEYYSNIDYHGMYMEAEYIGGSLNYDLALLKISDSDRLRNSEAVEAKMGDSNSIAVADTVFAVGNGGGDGISVTKGIISYTSENLTITGGDGVTQVSFRVIRFDSSINPGDSGGPVLNENGEVLGIINAKIIDSKYDNVGYGIPANVAKNIAENILYYYEQAGWVAPVQVKKLIFGVSYTNSEAYAHYDAVTGKITETNNLRIASVNEDSLVAGQMQAGDIITKVKVERGGEAREYELDRAYILTDLTLTIRAGDTVTLTYLRTVEGVSTEGTAVVEVTEDNLYIAK